MYRGVEVDGDVATTAVVKGTNKVDDKVLVLKMLTFPQREQKLACFPWMSLNWSQQSAVSKHSLYKRSRDEIANESTEDHPLTGNDLFQRLLDSVNEKGQH